MTEWKTLETFFEKGLNLSADERLQLLETLPPEKSRLRAEIQELWEHSHEECDFGELPQLSFQKLEQFAMQKAPKDLEVPGFSEFQAIARGSTSTVYRAKQLKPRRLVALKVLHCHLPSMDENARFELEQQALATLAHPNIATVFDAGVTPQGYPYFVMEFLDGQPLTQYCDKEKLSIEDRLRLFLKVCDAVTHAHQKQIIHRDLKPGNILVVERDGIAVPKIIDFGVAKLHEREIPAPYRTRAGMVIGTPAYMSPEQASGRKPEDVDTRADVYALGVLLFELLVGNTPLGQELAQAGSVRAMCALIERQDPIRPSRWLEKAGDQSAMANNRKLTQETLKQRLTQDLDWILIKALARDPFDRYQAVSEFSRDLKNYLSGFPINARPPKSLYLLKKLMIRHKRMVLAFALVTTMLTIGYGGTVWGFIQTKRAQEQAQKNLEELNAIVQFNRNLFANVSPYKKGRGVSGQELLDEAASRIVRDYVGSPHIEATLHQELAKAYKELGLLEQAVQQYQIAHALWQRTGQTQTKRAQEALVEQAYALLNLGRYNQAQPIVEEAITTLSYVEGRERYLRRAQAVYALILGKNGERDAAKSVFDEVLQSDDNLSRFDVAVYANYAMLLTNWGEPEEGLKLLKKSLKYADKLLGPENPKMLAIRHNHARSLQASKPDEAEKLFSEVLEARTRILGLRHFQTLGTCSDFAYLIGNHLKDPQRALDLLLPHEEFVLKGPPYEITKLNVAQNIGHFLMETGRHERASEVLARVITGRRSLLGEDHEKTFNSEVTLTQNLFEMGKHNEAIRDLEEIIQRASPVLGTKNFYLREYKKILKAFREEAKNKPSIR